METNIFENSSIDPLLIRGIKEMGFERPMPIQEKIIPVILEKDRDVVGLAQTGTGKTAAFGLPLIQKTDKKSKNVQAVVLCPTRELCMQITKDMQNYSKYVKDLRVVAIYGGASIEGQLKELRKKPQIIVATPGRLLDFIERNRINISQINSLVLDEADEMLNMGFKEELNAILEKTPESKNTYLFSATMPRDVANIASNYMNDAIEVSVGNRNAGAENVSHLYYMVQARNKYPALKRIVDINPDIYGIVFCRTRADTKEIAEKLIVDGYNADSLHGDLSQAQRDYVMHKFRSKNLQILVATDVAARGLDVDDLTHIINYNFPDELQTYTHRSGRTGRAGKRGVSIAIIHQKEKHRIKQTEKLIKKKFERQRVPDGKTICEKQLFSMIDRMERVEVDDSKIDPYLEVINKKLNWLTKEQLIKQFVSLEFNRFLEYYKDAPDLNLVEGRDKRRERGERGERGDRGKKFGRSDVTRFFAKIGKKDNIGPPQIIGMINDMTGTKDIDIGKIEILSTFTFFEVDKASADKILKNVAKAEIKRKQVHIEVAEPPEKNRKKAGAKKRPFPKKKKFKNRDNKRS
ncbi:MAG: DEAD/DEAH box helicase [Acidobacteriota bacterium]